MTIRIETERLILRPLELTDEDDLLEYQSHPEIVRYIPWPERTREEVRSALEKSLRESKEVLREDGDYLLLAWEVKSSGKVIGQSNISLRSTRDKCADIGWVTHQDFQNQGFAYEASSALLPYAFNHFDLHRIIADIDSRSPHSAKLAEKLGMRREGTFKDGEFFKGAWCDMWLYAILKDEFSA